MQVVCLYSSLVMNKKSLNNFPWLLKSAECFYRTRNIHIQYIGDKCRVSVRFSVVGVHCHSLVLLPLAITEHISEWHMTSELSHLGWSVGWGEVERPSSIGLSEQGKATAGSKEGSDVDWNYKEMFNKRKIGMTKDGTKTWWVEGWKTYN